MNALNQAFLRVGCLDKAEQRRQAHAECSEDYQVFADDNPPRLACGGASLSRAGQCANRQSSETSRRRGEFGLASTERSLASDRAGTSKLRAAPIQSWCDNASARYGSRDKAHRSLRAALLRATSDQLAACVIVGMMSTYKGLLSDCIAPHTWMLFPAGWSETGGWPDLAATGAPSPLLLQFLLDDALFTVGGMRDADSRIAATYAQTGEQNAYTGEFYPGPHRFDVPMQEAEFFWLQHHL